MANAQEWTSRGPYGGQGGNSFIVNILAFFFFGLLGPVALAISIWTGALWRFLAREPDETPLFFLASRAALLLFIIFYCILVPYIMWNE